MRSQSQSADRVIFATASKIGVIPVPWRCFNFSSAFVLYASTTVTR